jgi:serine/threonine protein kinase
MGLEDYKIIRCVGKGSFGKVYLCRHIRENKHYCMKCIKLTNIPAAERAACRHEVKLMQRLNHPNIVGYKDSFFAKRGTQLCIVMTYCDGGDLSERIKRQEQTRKRLNEDQVLHWFVQIALGLHFMHENHVLHRDLKTQNIFLLGNGRLVLGDLGISKVLEGKQDFAQTCIGTPYYMSPEIFKNKPYNHKSDVWALGCILYELCTSKHAFDAKSLNGLASKIMRGTYQAIPRCYSTHTRKLVTSMLSKSPHQRPDLSAILQMPFIKKRVANFMSDVIMSKPSVKIGAGTMVVRGAFMNVGGIQGGAGGIDANSAKDMMALQSQLEKLGMKQMISDALNKCDNENNVGDNDVDRTGMPPTHGKQRGGSSNNKSCQSSNQQFNSNKNTPSSDRRPLAPRVNPSDARAAEARRRQREAQRDARDALRREKERKAAVEHALEKLRKERESRMKERIQMQEQRIKKNALQKQKNLERARLAELRRKKDVAKKKRSEKNAKEELDARKEREARAIEERSKRRHEAAEKRRKQLEKEQANKHEKEQQKRRMVRQRSNHGERNVQKEIDQHREHRRNNALGLQKNKYRHANPQRIRSNQNRAPSAPPTIPDSSSSSGGDKDANGGDGFADAPRRVRDLDEWDRRNQKKMQEKADQAAEDQKNERKKRIAMRQKDTTEKSNNSPTIASPQTPVKFAKNKWKEENAKMGDILEQHKKKREMKEAQSKKRLAEVSRAHAVAQEASPHTKNHDVVPMDIRKKKVEIEREQRRYEQGGRDIVTGKPPRFQPPRVVKSNKMMKLKEQMKANLSKMDEDIKRMKDEQREKAENKKMSKKPVVNLNVFPPRRTRSNSPEPPPPAPNSPSPAYVIKIKPPSDLQEKRLRKKEAWANSGRDAARAAEEEAAREAARARKAALRSVSAQESDHFDAARTDKYAHLSARDQVLAKKRERQRERDEEIRKEHLAAAEENAKLRKRAQEKSRAQYQESSTHTPKKANSRAQQPITPLPPIQQEKEKDVIQGVMMESLERGPSMNEWLPNDRYDDEESEEFSRDHFASKYEEPMVESKIEQPIFEDAANDIMGEDVDVDLIDLEEEEDDDDDFEPSSFVVDEEDEAAEEKLLAEKEEELRMELSQADARMATIRATMNMGREAMGRKVVEDPEEEEDDEEEEEEVEEELQGGRNGGIRGGGNFSRLDEVDEYEQDYEQGYDYEDDDQYYEEFELGPEDHVPKIQSESEKREDLRKKCEKILGRVEFAACYKILSERYDRMDREEGTRLSDRQEAVDLTMQKVRSFFRFFFI